MEPDLPDQVVPDPPRADVPWQLRHPTKGQRARFVSMDRLSRAEIAIGRLLYPETGFWRPQTRADCAQVPRPCPYVGCKYHLFLDVNRKGNIRIAFDGEPWEMEESCALDIIDRRPEGMSLEETGKMLGLTRERIRQMESEAMGRAGDGEPVDIPVIEKIDPWEDM